MLANRDLCIFIFGVVRMKGLEPPRLSAPDPKSGAATNYATSAFFTGIAPCFCGCKYTIFFMLSLFNQKENGVKHLFLFKNIAINRHILC
jgi:hypothetical protein